MPTFVPADVETMLRSELARKAENVFAPPLPGEIDTQLPCVLVTRTGGRRTAPVIDVHEVRVDVWARAHQDAMGLANALAGHIASLSDDPEALARWRAAEIAKLPYENPDEAHADLACVSFEARLVCRAEQR